MHLRPLIVVSVLLFPAAALAGPNDIFGTWLRGDGAARVKMAACGNDICATNLWIKDPAGQKEKVGDRLVFRIAPKGDGWSGSGYDPQRNLNLSATLKAAGDSMQTTGCVLGDIICRSTQWTRN